MSMKPDLQYLIDKYHAEVDYSKQIARAKELLEEFKQKYSLEKFKNMTIHDYALGRGTESYGWWIEYYSGDLGSIKGGSASKHIIYFSKDKNEWIYPSQFTSVDEAWDQLREDFLELIEKFANDESIDSTNLLYSANTVKTKTLFLFYPEKLMPIYSIADIRLFLTKLHVDRNIWRGIKDDSVQLNRLLKETVDKIDYFNDWDPIKITNFLYYTWKKGKHRYVKVSAGKDPNLWDECRENNYVSIGWNKIGDLRNYPDYQDFKEAFKKIYYTDNPTKSGEKANEVWLFYSLELGDKVIVNRGTSRIFAVGTVTEKAYEYNESLKVYKHIVHVDWDEDFSPITIPEQKYWAFKTVYELTEKDAKNLLKGKKKQTVQTDETEELQETFEVTEAEERFFQKMKSALDRKGQCILYGPPGTGKTYSARKFIDWHYHQLALKQNENNVTMCTFHPSFVYEDFIEGFKPYSQNGQVSFTLESGIFKSFCEKAKQHQDVPHYFLIDELNRGNIPKIFGELITMIEKDKRGVEVTLPQSKEPFSIPENVYIIGTMNTSDRSIKMMDSALKRRFAFIECMPNYDVIDQVIDPLANSPANILRALNERLLEKVGRDKLIGHAYFMKDGEQILTIAELQEVFEFEIIPLLQEYCFDNYDDLAYLLGEEMINVEEMTINADILNGQEDAFMNAINAIIKGN